MNKSPWAILIIGVIGVAMLVVLGKTYLGRNLQLQLKTELTQKYGIENVVVELDERTGEFAVGYKIEEAAFGNDNAVLRDQMRQLADFAYTRFEIKKIRITAKSSESDKSYTQTFARD